MSNPTNPTNPTPPPLPQSVIDGGGIPCTPPAEPSMPELRDADPSKLQPTPLDWQGLPKATP